jgi:hypothetical protein
LVQCTVVFKRSCTSSLWSNPLAQISRVFDCELLGIVDTGIDQGRPIQNSLGYETVETAVHDCAGSLWCVEELQKNLVPQPRFGRRIDVVLSNDISDAPTLALAKCTDHASCPVLPTTSDLDNQPL